MDNEFERIREIRKNLEVEYNDVATSFFGRNKKPFISHVLTDLEYFIDSNRKGKVDESAEKLVSIIYSILDNLARQGIYPDNILIYYFLMIYKELNLM